MRIRIFILLWIVFNGIFIFILHSVLTKKKFHFVFYWIVFETCFLFFVMLFVVGDMSYMALLFLLTKNCCSFSVLPDTGAFLDSMTEFTVDARSVTRKGEGRVKVIVTSPAGVRTEALVSNKNDGTYAVDYSVFEEGTCLHGNCEVESLVGRIRPTWVAVSLFDTYPSSNWKSPSEKGSLLIRTKMRSIYVSIIRRIRFIVEK